MRLTFAPRAARPHAPDRSRPAPPPYWLKHRHTPVSRFTAALPTERHLLYVLVAMKLMSLILLRRLLDFAMILFHYFDIDDDSF
jgi:hypothetical protein